MTVYSCQFYLVIFLELLKSLDFTAKHFYCNSVLMEEMIAFFNMGAC